MSPTQPDMRATKDAKQGHACSCTVSCLRSFRTFFADFYSNVQVTVGMAATSTSSSSINHLRQYVQEPPTLITMNRNTNTDNEPRQHQYVREPPTLTSANRRRPPKPTSPLPNGRQRYNPDNTLGDTHTYLAPMFSRSRTP